MFGRVLLKPKIGRKAVYDSVHNLKGRNQRFIRISCSSDIPLDVAKCIGAEARDPEAVLGPAHGDEVLQHFGILSKSLTNGWPFLTVHSCSQCNSTYLVYFAVFEPRNGCRQAVLQGITELAPSNKALKSQPSAAGDAASGAP